MSENSKDNSSPITLNLNLLREINCNYEICGIIVEGSSCLILTSNGTYEMSGRNLKQIEKVDAQKIGSKICMVKEGIVCAVNGSIVFMKRVHEITRSRRRFYEQQVISKVFSEISQMINLNDSSIIVLGKDFRRNSKTVIINVSTDSMMIVNELVYPNLNLKGIVSTDRRTFSVLAVDSSSKMCKIIQLDKKTLKRTNSVELDNTINVDSVKMCKAFNNNIVIGYGNRIISCSDNKVRHNATISDEDDTSVICSMMELKNLLVVFYKSGAIYVLNNNLEVVSKNDPLFSGESLVKCEILSNYSLAMTYKRDKSWSLKILSYKIQGNAPSESSTSRSFKTYDSVHSILETYRSIEKCVPATLEEKANSAKKFKDIASKPDEVKNQALISLNEYFKSIGTEIVLCNSEDKKNFTNKLHATLLLNGFLSSNPYYYSIEFQSDELNSTNSNESNIKFFKQFRLFIGNYCEIPVDDIIIIRATKKNLCIDFTFTKFIFHKKFASKVNELNNLRGRFIDQFGYKKIKLIKVDVKPTLKEFKLNLNIFNSKFDKKYERAFNDERGDLPYYTPIGWIRLGIDFDYFGYKSDEDWMATDERQGEWAVGYQGLRTDPLGLYTKSRSDSLAKIDEKTYNLSKNVNKLDKDGFGKPCGDGIALQSKINNVEKWTFTSANSIKLAIMCRINPTSIKIPETSKDLYVANNIDNIRPYGIILKIK